MIPCSINKRRADHDRLGFTLVEMLMAVAFSVLLMTGVCGFYMTASQSYSSGISGQTLQDSANVILSKVIEGETEPTGVYRLATSSAYTIACTTSCTGPAVMYICGGNPQTAPCNPNSPYSELFFCQDSPCTIAGNTVVDATARWYYLNSNGTSIIYHHPSSSGGTVEENIYTAPAGSTLNIRFEPAGVATPSNVVEIDVALNQTRSSAITNALLTTSGVASTYVLLRDHP